MQYWLFKSEPTEYSLDDLRRERVGQWSGVRNYQARNLLRNVKRGDQVLFYHSNIAVPAVVGIAEVTVEAYPDPTQFEQTSDYYDPKAAPENPRWSAVDIQYCGRFSLPVPLADLRQEEALAGMPLLARGQRLSVQPVTAAQFRRVTEMGQGGREE